MTYEEVYGYCERMLAQNSDAAAKAGDIRGELMLTGRSPGTISVETKNGIASLSKAPQSGNEVSVIIDSDDFGLLLNGSLNPVAAFMNGRIKVRGNTSKLLSLLKKFGM